jgi:hypothetical protein
MYAPGLKGRRVNHAAFGIRYTEGFLRARPDDES